MSNTFPSTLGMSHDANSAVQKALESEVCSMLPQLQMAGATRIDGDIDIKGATIKVDAVFETAEEKVYAEIYCHIGKLNPSQRNKMLVDAAKLTLLNDHKSGQRIRKLVVLAGCNSNQSAFGTKSWRWQFLANNNIEFVHHPLSEHQLARLSEAIARQQRGNTMRKKQNKHLPTAG